MLGGVAIKGIIEIAGKWLSRKDNDLKDQYFESKQKIEAKNKKQLVEKPKLSKEEIEKAEGNSGK